MRHLWLNLSGIKECDKAVLLDAPFLPSGLFDTTVEIVVVRFKEVRMHLAAFGMCIPRWVQVPPKSFAPLPGTSSWREEQKMSEAAQAPPPRSGGHRHCNRRKPCTNLRAVSAAKKKEKKEESFFLLFFFFFCSSMDRCLRWLNNSSYTLFSVTFYILSKVMPQPAVGL